MTEQASSTLTASTGEERADGAAKVPRWWQSVDLGQSVVTPGCKAPLQRPSERPAIHPPVRHHAGLGACESVSLVTASMG